MWNERKDLSEIQTQSAAEKWGSTATGHPSAFEPADQAKAAGEVGVMKQHA